jgi:hypothetical protein
MLKLVNLFSGVTFGILLFTSLPYASNDSPEWDGVYLKDRQGSFEEMKEVSKVTINSSPRGILYYNTKDFTIIPPERFKGILVKGKDFLQKVTFMYVERSTQISLIALFNRSKAKYEDTFSLDPNPKIYELKSRQVSEDSRYYEPGKDAMQVFGTADEGHFVMLKAGNGKIYIFGIKADVRGDK